MLKIGVFGQRQYNSFIYMKKISVLSGYGTPIKFDHIGHTIWMDIKQSFITEKVLRPEFPKFQRHVRQYVSNTDPYQ